VPVPVLMPAGGATQDVNKEAGAEDMFKKISEAYEVGRGQGATLPWRAMWLRRGVAGSGRQRSQLAAGGRGPTPPPTPGCGWPTSPAAPHVASVVWEEQHQAQG
jgi:hypothetical protein